MKSSGERDEVELPGARTDVAPCSWGDAPGWTSRRAAGAWLPAGQAVQRHRIAIGAVLLEAVAVLARRPAVELVAVVPVVHQRHAVAARILDPVDVDHDHGA